MAEWHGRGRREGIVSGSLWRVFYQDISDPACRNPTPTLPPRPGIHGLSQPSGRHLHPPSLHTGIPG